jgi:flagellar basal body rod protein FlgG
MPMNIGMYQSAASLSALERWQEIVSRNITSSDQAAYRKRTISFSAEMAGELQSDPSRPVGHDNGMPMIFPKVNTGINFVSGETEPTRRDLDVAIQGEGFFEVQRPDGSKVYTRDGEFRMRPDRTLVTSTGDEVMSSNGSPIMLQPNAGDLVINGNGSLMQGSVPLGKLAVVKFSDNAQLNPLSGGYFSPPDGMQPESVDNPSLLQGYVEGSNTSSLREMVDLVVISRAYEANQKMITTMDEQMGKALDALG